MGFFPAVVGSFCCLYCCCGFVQTLAAGNYFEQELFKNRGKVNWIDVKIQRIYVSAPEMWSMVNGFAFDILFLVVFYGGSLVVPRNVNQLSYCVSCICDVVNI